MMAFPLNDQDTLKLLSAQVDAPLRKKRQHQQPIIISLDMYNVLVLVLAPLSSPLAYAG